ncbi:type IV secretion system DNA-binding domain-containing protein [Patescibacteria group bacterium]|nr:type IV secretion system DNA-binding domain-containing protein [Patescibacteria group bacterium]
MDSEKITYFAMTDSRGKQEKFGIKRKDRNKHMYIIGKTGMGKSTLLENMAIQDIQNGEGLAFIDPHGASAEKLLDYIPEERIKDVLYFAPFDMEHPVAFNVMEDVGYDKRHLVVSGLMSAFKKIWVDAWSGRMEYILSNTLLALLEYPDSTLLDVNRMLINKSFRKKVVENISDPLVKVFWVEEFAAYTDRYTQEATPAIQNKVGQFTSNPLIRNIIGQPKSTFDLRDIMDNKKIFIANLSKGRIGETNADLIGSMLTTKIYLSAMSRADLPAAELQKLPDFYFYVDEFQSIANESFANILSEARKYKLNLTIAHQYIEQMEESVRNAVFGNVGTTIAFRVGPFDAEVLETIFKPQFTEEDLVNLGFAQIYLTLMINGVGSKPFSGSTLPPIEIPRLSYREQVVSWSRQNYGRPRGDIETEIKKRGEAISAPEKTEKKDVARPPSKNVREDRGEKRVQENRSRLQSLPQRTERKGTERPAQKNTEQKEENRSALREALASVIQKEEEIKKSSSSSQTPTPNEQTDKKEVPEEKLRNMLGVDDK